MAIRLRRVGQPPDRRLIAICAARSVEKPGDIYLDDEMHGALSIKFNQDHVTVHGGDAWSKDCLEVQYMEQEESNNVNRTDWDECFGPNRTRDPGR